MGFNVRTAGGTLGYAEHNTGPGTGLVMQGERKEAPTRFFGPPPLPTPPAPPIGPAPGRSMAQAAPAPASMFRGSNSEDAAGAARSSRALARRTAAETAFVPFRRDTGALGSALRTRTGG